MVGGEEMYHTHVFVYRNDWFRIIFVMRQHIHASSHPSMFDILETIADPYCGKNCTHEMCLYSRHALNRPQNNRLENVKVSQSIQLVLHFVVPKSQHSPVDHR